VWLVKEREGVTAFRARGHGATRGIWWFLVELLVVFVGVYAAFVLGDDRERSRLETKKAQVYAALLEELRAHATSWFS
jgi:hypothetical protein